MLDKTVSLTHKDVCPYFDETCVDIGCVCPKYLAYERAQDPKAVADKIGELGIDPNTDPLDLMIKMQSLFAARFHKVEGLTKDEIDHWIRTYDTCITDEVTEVYDHLGVFSDGTPRKENIVELRKEFIDIWHFLMDEFLVAGLSTRRLVEIYERDYGGDVMTSPNRLEAIFINERLNDSLGHLGKDEVDYAILIHSNLILMGQRRVRKQISWKHWKRPLPEINFDRLHSALVYTFRALVRCFILCGLNHDNVREIYVKKNIENVFRSELNY